MNTRILSHGIAAACISGAIGLCAPSTPASANGQGWTANGGSACAKYLTPDVVAAILNKPATPVAQIDANSCHAGDIYITLISADIDIFKMEVPRIFGAHLMSGVGDMAYWNQAGAVSAVKGHDRGCDISVITAPYSTKVHDEVLGKKLGEICTKLFALP